MLSCTVSVARDPREIKKREGRPMFQVVVIGGSELQRLCRRRR